MRKRHQGSDSAQGRSRVGLRLAEEEAGAVGGEWGLRVGAGEGVGSTGLVMVVERAQDGWQGSLAERPGSSSTGRG